MNNAAVTVKRIPNQMYHSPLSGFRSPAVSVPPMDATLNSMTAVCWSLTWRRMKITDCKRAKLIDTKSFTHCVPPMDATINSMAAVCWSLTWRRRRITDSMRRSTRYFHAVRQKLNQVDWQETEMEISFKKEGQILSRQCTPPPLPQLFLFNFLCNGERCRNQSWLLFLKLYAEHFDVFCFPHFCENA